MLCQQHMLAHKQLQGGMRGHLQTSRFPQSTMNQMYVDRIIKPFIADLLFSNTISKALWIDRSSKVQSHH